MASSLNPQATSRKVCRSPSSKRNNDNNNDDNGNKNYHRHNNNNKHSWFEGKRRDQVTRYTVSEHLRVRQRMLEPETEALQQPQVMTNLNALETEVEIVSFNS